MYDGIDLAGKTEVNEIYFDETKNVKVYEGNPYMFWYKDKNVSSSELFDVVAECYEKNQYGVLNLFGTRMAISPDRRLKKFSPDDYTLIAEATNEMIKVFSDILRQKQIKALIKRDEKKYLELKEQLEEIDSYSVDPSILETAVVVDFEKSSNEKLEAYGINREAVERDAEGAERDVLRYLHWTVLNKNPGQEDPKGICVVLNNKPIFVGKEHPDITLLSLKNTEFVKSAMKKVEGPKVER